MPPCAAMECARRGESWKQKHWTLYPNSPSVAAADPPASPDPTMMMLYFRLLAGFTSLRLNLCLSQRVSMGPAGILASSSICAPLLQRQHTGEDRPYHDDVVLPLVGWIRQLEIEFVLVPEGLDGAGGSTTSSW